MRGGPWCRWETSASGIWGGHIHFWKEVGWVNSLTPRHTWEKDRGRADREDRSAPERTGGTFPLRCILQLCCSTQLCEVGGCKVSKLKSSYWHVLFLHTSCWFFPLIWNVFVAPVWVVNKKFLIYFFKVKMFFFFLIKAFLICWELSRMSAKLQNTFCKQ